MFIEVLIPQQIAADSWLNEPKYKEFVKAYDYACTQTCAISALAKCSPEEIYMLFVSLNRGFKI